MEGCDNLGVTTKLRTSEIASGMYHNLAMGHDIEIVPKTSAIIS